MKYLLAGAAGLLIAGAAFAQPAPTSGPTDSGSAPTTSSSSSSRAQMPPPPSDLAASSATSPDDKSASTTADGSKKGKDKGKKDGTSGPSTDK